MKLIVAFINFLKAPKKTSENSGRTKVDQDSYLLKKYDTRFLCAKRLSENHAVYEIL
jgi:hypothetical protein